MVFVKQRCSSFPSNMSSFSAQQTVEESVRTLAMSWVCLATVNISERSVRIAFHVNSSLNILSRILLTGKLLFLPYKSVLSIKKRICETSCLVNGNPHHSFRRLKIQSSKELRETSYPAYSPNAAYIGSNQVSKMRAQLMVTFRCCDLLNIITLDISLNSVHMWLQ